MPARSLLRPRCRLSVLSAFVLLALISMPRRGWSADNLFKNPDLALGSGNQPDDWRTEAWVSDPSAVTYRWVPGEVTVVATKENDARYMQTLSLGPGWYHLTVEIRTENVGNDKTGATISVMEDGISSKDIKNTTDWTPVELYLKVGSKGADVDVALRVGGYGSLNTGTAHFRKASAVKIDAPPEKADHTYDLEQIRGQSAHVPVGSPISLFVTFALLAIVVRWSWKMFAQAAPKAPTRADVRREVRRSGRR